MRIAWIVIATALSSACASPGPTVNGPLDEVRPGGLDPGHGYLIVRYETNGPVHEVRIAEAGGRATVPLGRAFEPGLTTEIY
jgi:hypothetical protein